MQPRWSPPILQPMQQHGAPLKKKTTLPVRQMSQESAAEEPVSPKQREERAVEQAH